MLSAGESHNCAFLSDSQGELMDSARRGLPGIPWKPNRLELKLDGSGKAELDTGAPFLHHMLDQVARHGLIDMTVKATGLSY